jgi:predicted RNase H-like HicB family nuclease
MGKYIFQAIMTPAEEGGFDVEVPDLPGCFTYGDDVSDAAFMAADAAKTYVATLLADGVDVPAATTRPVPAGCESVHVFFETDESYIVDGPVVSAAEASRMLGVSPGRVTHMIDSGILDGYRRGRRTWVSEASVRKRMESKPGPGRPALQA